VKVFPSNKDEWLALLLFPFKAYIVLVYPFYRIFRTFYPQPFLGTMVSDGTFYTLSSIFVFCLVTLFIGATIQLVVSGREYALVSMAFVVIPVVILFALRFI